MKVLKFSSPTCAPCKVLNETLKNENLEGIEIESYSLDENKDIFMRYNVRSVPHLIHVNEETGEPLQKWQMHEFLRFLRSR